MKQDFINLIGGVGGVRRQRIAISIGLNLGYST
jgi:2-phosphoglycerate kinase